MKKVIVGILVVIFSSCTQKRGGASKTYEPLLDSFMSNVYDGKYDNAINNMHSQVIDSIDHETLKLGLHKISVKLHNEFESEINLNIISTEPTIHDDMPAVFLICKLESKKKFGYYFFYIHESTKTILLVSEFSRVKDKRG